MLERRTPTATRRFGIALLLAAALPIVAPAMPLPAQEAQGPPAAAPDPADPGPANPGPASAEPLPAEPAPEPPPAPPAVEPAEPAEAPEEPSPERRERRRGHRNDAQVIVGSSLVIEEDETSNDVVVVGGSLTVLGEVYGDAAAIGGSVVIEGRVTGDVSAVGGSVTLAPGAEVDGDAMSFGGSVTREEGGTIRGEVVEVSGPGLHWSMWPSLFSWGDWSDKHDHDDLFDYSPFDWALSQAWEVFCFVVLVLAAFLALLLGRTPIERIGRRIEAEPWKTGLVGLAAQILFMPLLLLLIVVLAVSIIGIPFLFLIPFALIAIAVAIFLGYVGVALKVGDLLRARFGWSIESSYIVLLVGLVGLGIWSFIGNMIDVGGSPLRLFAALFLLFGFLVCYVAWTLATGGALLTRFGTADSWARRPAAALPPAAPQPPPAPEPGPEPHSEPPAAGDEPWQPEVDEEKDG